MATKSTSAKSSRAQFLGYIVLIVALGWGACSFLDGIKERWFIFDPPALHALSAEAVALHPTNITALTAHILTNLSSTYPAYTINTDISNPSEWVFNNAGGAMGAMFIIHASITEYLIVFGTPLGTEGHSGRHTADDYFNILRGEQWAFSPGSMEMERYVAGQVHHMRRGDAKQYKFHEGGWALELAQGWIPPMLPFGFADFASTLDFPTMYNTVRLTGREMIKNLLHGKI
ncbi:C-8 isomerase [Phaffia rhodozyma]|uniref:C-8 sterol isomerase n=1 Tax=Phaffia rhodozyma TaxID=264483 RepID=A0A0F7SRL8_PHARH|nr:C-8 isomerase [Phaffia rhodozyma]